MAGMDVRARRFWFDPRFAIGVGLIAVSVAGTALVISTADSSVEVLAARDVLTPGERITRDDLVVTRVGLEQAAALYLGVDDAGDDELVVTRTVDAGELVPASAVGSVDGLHATRIVVTVSGRLASSIVPGTTADVWAATATEQGEFGPPVVIVPDATVVRLIKPDGIVIDESSGSVEVLVPTDTVARVLEAVANDDAISLVPVSLPAGG